MSPPSNLIKIFLIEDNPADVVLLKEYLDPAVWTGLRFEVLHSDSLTGVTRSIREFQPDIILSDLHLGGSNGVETIEKLKPIAGDIPVVVLTGTDDVELGIDAINAGASDYLIKGEHLMTTLPLTIRFILERLDLQKKHFLLEQQLLENQKLESLGVMAGGIAHDFNNILAGIMGSAGLGKTDLPEDSPVQLHLDTIIESVLRASELCKQMLDYSGDGQTKKQLISPTPFLKSICSSYEGKAETGDYTFTHQVDDALPQIVGDEGQLLQLLKHIHANAVEAIAEKEDGQIHLHATVEHSQDDLANLFITIRDNGVGMSKEVASKAFEPFYTTKFQGRGLGLAAVQGIARGLKGKVRIESTPGEGTLLVLNIPLASPNTTHKTRPRPGGDSMVKIPKDGSVLLIDDDDHLREICKRCLIKWDMEVLEASGGIDGIRIYKENFTRIAFVLLDVTMPDLLGDEVFAKLREHDPELPVIFMSGFNPTDPVKYAIGQGHAEFLAKPFRINDLKEAIEKVTSDRV